MNDNTESPSAALEYLKWAVVFAVVAVGVVGNNIYAEESVLYRVLALMGLGVVAVFIGFQTVRGVAFWKLIKEARTEIRKVVWPTQQETTQTTLIVFVVVFVMALFLFVLDWGLNQLMSYIIG